MGFALREILEGGWHVFAGQFMPEWLALDALREKYPDALEILPLDVGVMHRCGPPLRRPRRAATTSTCL